MRVQATVLALLLLLAVAVPVAAQRTTASIRGTVTDATGGVVPGADVTVKGTRHRLHPVDRHQHRRRLLVSRAAGRHLHGRGRAQRIQVGGRRRASRSTSRTCSARWTSSSRPARSPKRHRRVAAMAVKTIGGEVAGLVTGEQVRELPLNGRNFLQLATLMPGVSRATVSTPRIAA